MLDNYKSGNDIFDINIRELAGATAGGAIASIPGLNLLGTMAVGSLGNVANATISGAVNLSELLSGNRQAISQVIDKALVGSVSGYFGYKGQQFLSNKISRSFNDLSRYGKKAFLYRRFNIKPRDINKVLANMNSNKDKYLVGARAFYFGLATSSTADIMMTRGKLYLNDHLDSRRYEELSTVSESVYSSTYRY